MSQREQQLCGTFSRVKPGNPRERLKHMQLFRKTENIAENIYEKMPDQELFLMLRDDLLHSRTGIKLEAVLEKNDREKFRAEVTEYIRRIYRISDVKIQRFVTYIEQYIFKFHVLT